MSHKVISTSDTPEIILENIQGNLQVKGWDRSEVLVKAGAEENYSLNQEGDTIKINSNSDCLVRLPQEASLRAKSIEGNARVKLIDGQLEIGTVNGNLALRNVGAASIDAVRGNLLVKQVAGDLQVRHVDGGIVARDIQGSCAFLEAAGNLDLRDAEDDLQATCAGNARVQIGLLMGKSYSVKAGGNMQCRVSEDASAAVSLVSGAQQIQIKLPGDKKSLNQSSHTLTLGGGEASMQLTAGGNIFFSTQASDWSEHDDLQAEFDEAFAGFSDEFGAQFSEQIESQIESQMEMLNEQLEELGSSLSRSGLSPEASERLMERAKQASARASARAQAKMQRAQERMERKLAAAQRKAEFKARAAERRSQAQGSRGWSFSWGTDAPAAESKTQVSDEERLMILRMLEQKKISLDEAEQLLAALEGR